MKLQSFVPTGAAPVSRVQTTNQNKAAITTQHLLGMQKDQLSLSRMGTDPTKTSTNNWRNQHLSLQDKMSNLFHPFKKRSRH
jgi:hypothetical protein